MEDTTPAAGVGLFEDPPAGDTVRRDRGMDSIPVWVWTLPGVERGYWIECSYGAEEARIRRLPDSIHACKVGKDRDSAAAGATAIRAVACI